MGFRAGEALSFFVEYTAWNAPRQLIGACLIYLFRPLSRLRVRPANTHRTHTVTAHPRRARGLGGWSWHRQLIYSTPGGHGRQQLGG